jgi:hypothetical protein
VVFFLNPEYKMSSVTRFLRQIPTGIGQLNDATLGSAVDFVPTSGNYVGNYPPGFMVLATQTGLSNILTAYAQNGIARDMGKTIFAPYATGGLISNGNAGNFASYGYFRQYQLIVPTPISVTQGFLGGVGGNNFGVVGPAAATVPGTSTYVTFYLPTLVAGVGAAGGGTQVQDIGAGGQM